MESLQWLRGFYEAQLSPERTPGTVSCLERIAALAGLVEVQRHEALVRAHERLCDLHARMTALPEHPDAATLRQLNELMDATVAMVHEVWEPERSAFLEHLLPLQEQLRQLKAE